MGYDKNKKRGKPKKGPKNKGVMKNVPKSRKDLRKEKRTEKKVRKKDYFSRNKSKKEAKHDSVEDHDSDNDMPMTKAKPTPEQIKLQLKEEKAKKKEIMQKKREAKMKEIRKKQLIKANEDEDRMIKKLEKQLNMKKKKSGAVPVPKSFQLDGLSYLLDVCEKDGAGKLEKQLAEDSGSEFEEDFFIATGKKQNRSDKPKEIKGKLIKPSEESDEEFDDIGDNESNSDGESFEDDGDEGDDLDGDDFDESDFGSDPDDDMEDLKSNSKAKKPAQKRKIDSPDDSNKNKKSVKINDDSDDEGSIGSAFDSENSDFGENSDFDENDDDDHENKSAEKDDKTWEDIYGRKRDKEGNVIIENSGKYIPPSLRQNNSEGSKENVQLRRQIKGLLNKLTGVTMHWTSSELEKVYLANSRNSVNNTLCSLWMDSICKSITTSDRMAVEHAMLVAILHANVGTEVGAYFLQNFATKFSELMGHDQELEDKSLDNLILGICHLYNFKIFESALLYDILNQLTENLTEKNIECLLIAFRTMGTTLRKEDPLGLKTFIQTTQQNTKSLKTPHNNARAEFLMDVLLAIKNNNFTKIPNYDPGYLEEMKKLIKGIIRKGNRIVSLNISLKDLCSAKEKGKWWIVGSAWEGDLKPEKLNKTKGDEENKSSSYLMQLADAQRINTDLRRNIFVIIMSAEDYLDAFEKLLSLNLSAQQEREIINVLISCCLQENAYNAYYSVLAQKFCDHDRKYQMSIQYSVWDKIKDLESCQMFQIVNLARFLSHLFIERGLSISVLKIIQFAELNKQSMRLMRQILISILLYKDQQLCFDVFQRVVPSAKLKMFRESLRLFINHFLIKNLSSSKKALSDEEMNLLKERCLTVDRILHSDSRVEF